METAVTRQYAVTASIEEALSAAIDAATPPAAPAKLAQAMRAAVFPGGARLRPRLCLAVARALGAADLKPAYGAACAIELLHCASLVHDDLPCFDNAAERRGKASIHREFGERIAVLAGDALIVLAFRSVAEGAAEVPRRLVRLIGIVSDSVGMPAGIVAGQARECEPHVALTAYHLEKTGALFAAATMAGAAAAGATPEPWRALGERLGLAYQVADDICDVAGDPAALGKPVGKDRELDRPSAARELGLAGAIEQLDRLVAMAVDAVPACAGEQGLRTLIEIEARRFLPPGLARRAA